MTEISRRPHSEKEVPHWVEWAVGIVSAILIALIIGWVGFDALTEKDQSPAFKTVITRQEPIEGGFRVEFDIENSSNRTAAAVVVRGEVRDGDRVIEAAEATIDYVPRQSKASGAIIFFSNPDQRQVRIRSVAYSDP